MSSIASTIIPLMIDGTSLWHPLYRIHVYNHLQSVFIVRNSNKTRYFKHFMHGKAYTVTIWRQWRKAWLLFFSYTKYSCSVIDRHVITPRKENWSTEIMCCQAFTLQRYIHIYHTYISIASPFSITFSTSQPFPSLPRFLCSVYTIFIHTIQSSSLDLSHQYTLNPS